MFRDRPALYEETLQRGSRDPSSASAAARDTPHAAYASHGQIRQSLLSAMLRERRHRQRLPGVLQNLHA
ncbi:MAG TPA: hypothetical protein VH165_35010 [Kofleriaceae bacterium]|nr:hypothetical protein [Kofleriaceae bacterium]